MASKNLKTESKKPVVSLDKGDWLPSSITAALRNEYAKDQEAGQRGADHLVKIGFVQIPAGTVLKCVAVRKFGGALSFVCQDKKEAEAKAGPKAALNGIKLPK